MAGPSLTGFVIPASVSARSKADVQFDITGGSTPYANPFNFDEIQVDATVTAPDGTVSIQPCLPERPVTIATPTSGHGEIYGTPGTQHWWFHFKYATPGIHTWQITATDASGTTTTTVHSQTVTPADATTASVFGGHLGPWRRKNKWYYTFDDGTFIPMIGENMGVQDRPYQLDGTVGFTKFLADLANNGGGVVRFMMSAYHRNGIEWTSGSGLYSGFDNLYPGGVGKYSDQFMARIDKFLSLATLNGVTVIFCTDTHGEFSTSSNPQWANSPYNSANGGPVPSSDPALMLTNATAAHFQQMKDRLIQARFAPSPSVGAIELMNEIGSVGNGFFTGNNTIANAAAWCATRTARWTAWAFNLLTGVSEEWDPSLGKELAYPQNTDLMMDQVAIPMSHNYNLSPATSDDRRHTEPDMIDNMRSRLGKGALHAESGLYRSPSVPEANFDPTAGGKTQIQKNHLLAGTHVRQFSLVNIANGFSGGWPWWTGSGLEDDASKNRTSGTLPYGGTAVDTWRYPQQYIFQAAAAIAANEDPTQWPVPGGKLAVTAGAGLSARAWGYNQRALVYVFDTADNYGGSDVGNLVGRSFAGRACTVSGLLDGAYNVEVWSTRAQAAQVTFTGGDPTGVADSASALNAFFAANSGKVCLISPGTYRVNSEFFPAGWTGTILGNGASIQPHYNAAGKFYALRMQGSTNVVIRDLILDGSQVTSPATSASILSASNTTGNTREQEHAFAVYGGSNLTFINCTTKQFWGDGFWLTRYVSGDGSSPSNVVISNHTGDQLGRNGLSVISSGGTCWYLGATLTNIGFDCFDIEPNGSADVVGSWYVNGCSFATWDILHNNSFNSWGQGKAISSVGSSAVTRPLLDVRNCTYAKPSTSAVAFDVRYTTKVIADGNVANAAMTASFVTSTPTVVWGTNTNITPSPSKPFTAPPAITLPTLPAGGGKLSTIPATSAAGSLTFTQPTVDRDAFYKVIPVGGSGGSGGASVQVYDTGIRTVAPGGLGSADTGGAWTIGGTAGDYSVNGGQVAVVGSVSGATRRGYLPSVSWQENDDHLKVQTDKVPTGASQQVYLMARAQDLENNYYRATTIFKTDLSIAIQIDKVIGGVSTVIGAAVTPGRDTFAVGTEFWIRFQVTGVSPTTLSAKVWKVGTTEPSSFDVTCTDSTSPLQGPGSLGIRSYVGAATNTPVTFRFDEIQGLDTSGGVSGTVASSLSLSPAASGVVGASGSAAPSLPLGVAASGIVAAGQTAAITLSLAVAAAGGPSVTGVAAAALRLAVAASGTPIHPSTASRVVVIPGSGATLQSPNAYPQPAYDRLEITQNFWGGNSFIMTIRGAAQGASALVIGQLLWLPDEDDAVYEIESIETDKTGASRASANLIVSGRSVDGFVGVERVIVPDAGVDYDSQASVAAETAMKHYVREHAGINAPLPRQIPNLVVAPDLAQGAVASMDARYQTVGDALLQLGLLGPLGWETTIDPATGNLIFDVIEPTDRSASVFFDFDFGTISSWIDVQSILNSSTVAIVAGQGDLANRDVEVRYQGAEPTGFARREVFIDARDVTLGDLATLDARGDAYLAANAPTRSTAATVYAFGSFQPGRDWFLGDVVLLHDAVLGINEPARVVTIVKTYDASAAVPTVVATVGKPFPGVAGVLAAPAGGAIDTVITTIGDINTAVGVAVGGLSVGGANLVINSSFENTVAGTWLVGANWSAPYTAGGIYGLDSARCQLINQTAGDLVPVNFISINPTDDYWISFWSYLSAYTSGVARFSIREYDATGTLIATTNIDQSAVELAATRHTIHFGADNTTPGRIAWQAATTRIKIVFLTPAAATLTWQVDAVQVERGKIITSYAPAPQELVDGQVGTTQIADGAITTQKVIANAITAGKIAAGQITADKLAALLVLASLIKTADSGQRIELDAAGLRAIDASGNILVNVPTDGRPVKVTGEIDATLLVVAGNAVLQGTKNEFAASSVTQLDSYQSSPTQAPALASSLDGVSMPLDATYEPGGAARYRRSGLDYDAAGGAGGATKVFYTVSANVDGHPWPGKVKLLELKASDRTVNRQVDITIPDFLLHPNVAATAHCSVARLGAYVYVLIAEVNGGPVWVTRVQQSTFAVNATYGPIAGYANASIQIAFTTAHTGYGFRMEYVDNLGVDRGSTATFVVGTNFTAAAIQASLRSVTGDPGLTVTGTTDFGPFTITFSTGQPEQGFINSLFSGGLVSGALGAFVNTFSQGGFTVGGDVPMGLASDGTNLFIVGLFDAGGDTSVATVRWNKYDGSMVKVGSTINTSFVPGSGTFVADAIAGSFDLGAARIGVLIGCYLPGNAYAGTIQTFTTAGVRQANEPWFAASSIAQAQAGLTYGDALGDGARFWSYDGAIDYLSATALAKHSTWTWTTATPIYQVAYSWYDSNATGGTHETQVGPRAAITMARRRQLTVTAQPIPGAGGTDDPNNIRVYMVASATDPGATGLHLQGTAAALSQLLTSYASGGAADPASNSFSTVSVPAQLASQGTGFTFKGDGTINRTGTVFPTPVVAGDRYVRSDLGYTEWVYDGTRWLSANRYLVSMPLAEGSMPSVATGDVVWRMAHPGIGMGLDVWMERLDLEWYVSGGTALAAGTQQWVGLFQKVDASNTQTTIATITYSSGTLNAWHPNAQALGGGSVLALATYLTLILSYTKTGTPGSLRVLPTLSYRLIAT